MPQTDTFLKKVQNIQLIILVTYTAVINPTQEPARRVVKALACAIVWKYLASSLLVGAVTWKRRGQSVVRPDQEAALNPDENTRQRPCAD